MISLRRDDHDYFFIVTVTKYRHKILLYLYFYIVYTQLPSILGHTDKHDKDKICFYYDL